MEEKEMTTAEVETTGADTKTYTQADVDKLIADTKAEMKAKHEEGFQKKLDKAIARKMSEKSEEDFKVNQLIDVLKKQTKNDTIDDLLDMSEKQYKITIPRKQETSKEDAKVLGKYDAQQILEENDFALVNEEINRLANRTRNDREEETLNELNQYLQQKEKEKQREREIEEIREIGYDTKMVETDDFKAFSNKFSSETSMKDIAEMYGKLNNISKEDAPFNPGSAKDIKSNGGDEFFTVDEYMALTDKDLDNPKIYEKAMKSLAQFYKK